MPGSYHEITKLRADDDGLHGIISQIIQLPSPCCSLTPLVWTAVASSPDMAHKRTIIASRPFSFMERSLEMKTSMLLFAVITVFNFTACSGGASRGTSG